MTHEGFRKLPFLLAHGEVLAVTGYAERTMRKLIECGHLAVVKPAGATLWRFRKVQVALLAGLEWEAEAEEFRAESLMMKEKAVTRWTGYGQNVLRAIGRGRGLTLVRPAGMTGGKFRKVEVAGLLGLERYV